MWSINESTWSPGNSTQPKTDAASSIGTCLCSIGTLALSITNVTSSNHHMPWRPGPSCGKFATRGCTITTSERKKRPKPTSFDTLTIGNLGFAIGVRKPSESLPTIA